MLSTENAISQVHSNIIQRLGGDAKQQHGNQHSARISNVLV